MGQPAKQWQICCLWMLLCAATVAAFWPVLGNQFVKYDDGVYVADNPRVQGGLTWSNVRWAFQLSLANWHPLTWLSHMVDAELFGRRPAGHHAVSLALHTANALLLFGLLRRWTDAPWRSGFVAALFALHPLHVEWVAWAAERKDVLSTLFFLLTLLAYSRHVATEPSSRTAHCTSRYYLLALVLFACALMSKPMAVTLPFVLLLLDFWPWQRFQTAPAPPLNFEPQTPDSEPGGHPQGPSDFGFPPRPELGAILLS